MLFSRLNLGLRGVTTGRSLTFNGLKPAVVSSNIVTPWLCFSTSAYTSLEASSESLGVDLNRKTTKHVLLRKTFLVDYYKHLNDNNEIVLYAHHNNLLKNDTLRVRADLKKAGAQLTYVRNNLYNVYLRSAHEEDPALHKNTLRNKKVQHPLALLLNGPTAVITIPLCDPSVVAQVLKVLKSAGEKLFLIGGRIEASVYSVSQVDEFKTLPTKDQLQGQLAGLLTVLGGAGLVRTLESTGSMLYLTMGQREKDLGGGEKSEAESE